MVIDGLHLSSRAISGVAVCCGPPTDCVAAIDDSVGRGSVRLGFVNTFTAYLLGKSDRLQSVLRDFVLLNDGIGLDLVSLIKYGERFGFNLNGTDFTPFYLKSTRHKFEIFSEGTSNPWGVDFNDWGQMVSTACVIPHLFHNIDRKSVV